MKDTKKSVSLFTALGYLYVNEYGRSSDIYTHAVAHGADIALITVKRLLSRLVKEGVLATDGRGPATRYKLTRAGALRMPIDADAYCADEPDRRVGSLRYSFDLIPALTFNPFLPGELAALEEATATFRKRTDTLSSVLRKKEIERFVIELSWKSSRIEGNTYTLLDTERLLLHGEEAEGHTTDEANMILNHKHAFSFVYENQASFESLTRQGIEQVHALLTENLPIESKFRHGMVGVTGSRYQPLDNRYQIEEAVDSLCQAVNRLPDGYSKALSTILGLSYIQPFEDGNKRTARLMGNALLLAHDLSPLSYRSVTEEDYREAVLVFYELNSFQPFKELFIEQYQFAARTYTVI